MTTKVLEWVGAATGTAASAASGHYALALAILLLYLVVDRIMLIVLIRAAAGKVSGTELAGIIRAIRMRKHP